MKLVLIEWIDSSSGRGWQPLEDIKAQIEPLRCRSVGWLASERGGVKVVVPHISGEKNDGIRLCGTGELTIPNKCVVKMTVLRRG